MKNICVNPKSQYIHIFINNIFKFCISIALYLKTPGDLFIMFWFINVIFPKFYIIISKNIIFQSNFFSP